MAFVFTLIWGVCIGVIIGMLAGLKLTQRPDINSQIGNLYVQGKKKLQEVEEIQKKINRASLKIDGAKGGLMSIITDMDKG